MEKLNEFIIKQLNDKKVQRWVIMAVDLFELCNNMAILDDDELMIDVVEYLENNEIDINFAGGEKFHKDFVRLENKIKMKKILEGTKSETQLMMEKVDSIKVPERPEWLENYLEDEDKPRVTLSNEYPDEFERIKQILIQELTEKVENQQTPNINEIRAEIENEIGILNGEITGEGF